MNDTTESTTEPTEREPNIVDAAFELARRSDEDDGVMPSLLSAIFEQQEASRRHYDDVKEHWWAEERAKNRALRDAIRSAISGCDRLGTTASYERCLSQIQDAVYPPTRVITYYIEKEIEVGPFKGGPLAGDAYPPHPMYATHYEWAEA